MLAVRKLRAGDGRLERLEVPVPVPGHDEVVVRLEATGVDPTDIAIMRDEYRGKIPFRAPVTVGHEGVGVVVDAGAGARAALGRRVALHAILGEGECPSCRARKPYLCPDWSHLGIQYDGTFASHVLQPLAATTEIAEHVPAEAAAVMEPLAHAVHVADVLDLTAVSTAVLVGPGPVGLMQMVRLRAAGVQDWIVVGTERDEARLALAARLGARTVVGPVAARAAVGELDGGADLVIEACGDGAVVGPALTWVRPEGQVALLGFTSDASVMPMAIVRGDLRVVGAMAAGPAHYDRAARLLADGVVDPRPLVDATAPIDRWSEVLDAVAGRTVTKAVLTFDA